ncbi:putative ABC transport system permease protein [Catalinimonas alkaloidigena]|uniref:Putative ABC transport system permease protein n=1 Tax=Catalinimonas alkaloidigena TaxID=1075417 RepID=A0A1G8YEX5_9BACT|nr:ABC transporter permease [Catalinimonas alkaloidigena]SDK00964.1 putative ABC transport system permease protein [Catalinimonas alkaloidigena]
MLKSYFLVAVRSLLKQRFYSLINLFGLAIGIACCLLILQYVRYELSYDDFHTKKENLYRVQQDRYDKGELSTQWAAGAYAVGNSFKDAFPEVEEYVKVVPTGSLVVGYGEDKLKVEKIYFASSAFFEVFSYPLVQGNPATALTEPNTVVLSASTARNIFGDEDPLGKTVRLNEEVDAKVTGVYADLPANTHLKFDMLRSYATFVQQVGPDNNPDEAWMWDGCMTYLLLQPGTDPKALEAKFSDYVEANIGEDLAQYDADAVYLLQPLPDIHLYSHYMMEAEPNGDGTATYLLLGIAFFIIIIAWVNYINLATARAMNRAKEVGIRKSVGSLRSQLIQQFLMESAVLNALAVVLAILLVVVALPAFNRISGQELSFSLLSTPLFWVSLLALYLVGAFLSGLYPAFVLSAFNPATVLKGSMKTSHRGNRLRQGLVVLQFAASLFLLIGTLAVFRQISFMRDQDLGINIDQTLVIQAPIIRSRQDSIYVGDKQAFKQEMLRYPAIRSITASSAVPGGAVGWNAGGIRLKGQDASDSKQYRVIAVDYDFLDAYGLKLLAGRKFGEEYGNDPGTVVFSRTGVQQLGFDNPDDALNKEIEFWGATYTVVGVVDDFHQESLRETYEPLIFRCIPGVHGAFSVKVATSNLQETIAHLHAGWDQIFPGNPFEYYFLDDHFDAQYRADQRFGQVFGVFTGLAIFVACLGLFGLASFTTAQRTKEIGVRKVLGASVPQILQLLYRDFVKLVLVAFVLAVPLAYFAMHQWLQHFAFRIGISWWLFALPCVLVVLIAILTVSFQSIKAAVANPVHSLRSE